MSIACSILRTLAMLTRSGEPTGEPLKADIGPYQATSSYRNEEKHHVRPHLASVGDCPAVPSKHPVTPAAVHTHAGGQSDHQDQSGERPACPAGSHRGAGSHSRRLPAKCPVTATGQCRSAVAGGGIGSGWWCQPRIAS